MKYLSPAILLASALVLCAETPKPQPKQNARAQAPTQQEGTPSGPLMAATVQPTGSPTPSHYGPQTYNYYYDSKDSWDWPGIVEAVSTLGLLAFALWQMSFVKRTTSASEDAAKAAAGAANAATTSADVAVKQLRHIERPWITFEVIELAGTEHIFNRIRRLHPALREPENSPTTEIIQVRVRYRFNNCGRTPARLITGAIQFVCDDPKSLPPEPRYLRYPMPEALLPPGQSPGNSLIVQLFPPDFERFVKDQKALILMGFVQYRDILAEGTESSHESRFRMECHFPGYINAPGGDIRLSEPLFFAVAGPEAYNRYT